MNAERHRLPALHCYWVEPGVLLAGEHPGTREGAEAERRLASLLDAGIRVFIDLTEEGELEPYADALRRVADRGGVRVDHLRHPIRDLGVPRAAASMARILGDIAAARLAGRPAYVHCRGGVGRTGTVVGCRLRERGAGAAEVIEEIAALRRDSAKADRPSPETAAQREWVRSWPRNARARGSERPG